MLQKQKRTEPEVLIGGLFTFLLCTIGLALIAVFLVKLVSNSLQVALTDFLLMALGSASLAISINCNFKQLIFSAGGVRRINIIFCRLGFFLSGLLISIKLFAGGTSSYIRSLEEGGIVEWSSFVLLLSSACILFLCASLTRDRAVRVIFCALSVCAFVIGMEEMSWGQILFRWDTPASLISINAQGETNLHNIEFIHGHADLFYGCTLAVIIAFSLLVKKNASSIGEGSMSELIEKLAPPKSLLVFFLPACILILCLYLDIHEYTNGFTFKGEEEVAEMLGAFGLLGYTTSKASQFAIMKRNCG